MTRHAQKQENRLRRQFAALTRGTPLPRRRLEGLLHNRMRLVRAPVAVLLILGSLFAILPVFGLWMLPLGLMLLAVDVPALRPRVSAAIIRTRRRISLWRRKGRPSA